MSTTGINLDYTLNIRVLTPIHVGGSQEKHLYEGLDFIREHSKVYLIDQQKLLDKMNPSELAETMLSGQSGALKIALQRERVPLKDVCQEEPMFVEDVQFSEIKAFIKDGLKGKPFVPGSSLKGAIRSIVFAHLRGKSKYENEVLGLFERSIFRHIKVGDAFFDQLVLYPSKTFNLQGYQQSLKGGWRHGNGNTNATFSPTGSVFVYECLPAGTAGQLSLRILDHQSGLFQNLQQWDRREQTRERGRPLPEGLTSIIQAKPLVHLFSLINKHTLRHLRKEIDFFKTYKVAETAKILVVLEELEQLLSNTTETGWCILRMAHGSGFHSITGDWQYPISYADPRDVHQGGRNSGVKKYKSRKLLFKSGQFYPMGFVLLSLADVEIPDLGSLVEGQVPLAEDTPILAPAIPSAPITPTFYKGKIRLNTELNAVIVKSGVPNQVRVYLNEQETIDLPLSGYKSALSEGLVILVIVKNLGKKGELKEIGFSKMKT